MSYVSLTIMQYILCLQSSVGVTFKIILKSLIVAMVIGGKQSMLQQAEHPGVIEIF